MSPETILALFRERGALAYEGEGITQLQHAFQCGHLAAAAGATPALQLAAWLHDVGHLMSGLDGSPTTRGIDDAHEHLAARALRLTFGDAVAEPVALHVQAKRYLVATHPPYQAQLSPDSRRSLALQGGPMDGDEALAFRGGRFAEDALRLRAWDERGKRPDWKPDSDDAALAELAELMSRVQAQAAPLTQP